MHGVVVSKYRMVLGLCTSSHLGLYYNNKEKMHVSSYFECVSL